MIDCSRKNKKLDLDLKKKRFLFFSFNQEGTPPR